jgi:hypothetical protein
LHVSFLPAEAIGTAACATDCSQAGVSPRKEETIAMSITPVVKPGERDPKLPTGLPAAIVAAIALCSFMYVMYPGHGPIQGHMAVPAADAKPG